VLVGNADIWGTLDLTAVVSAQDEGVATLAVLPHSDPTRWSSVVLDGGGRVREFLPPGAHGDGERFLFTGFQLLGREVVAALPSPPCEMVTVWNALRQDGRLRGVVVTGEWHEAGTPSAYRQLVIGSLAGTAWVHPAATVENGSFLVGSAVGAGCRVAAGAQIAGCVVTAGARVEAGSTLRDCVIAGPVCLSHETIVGTLVVPGRRVPLR
jgi:mannose-1-phosphate guanylyltransferase